MADIKEREVGEWFAHRTNQGFWEVSEVTDKYLMGVRMSDLVCMLPFGPGQERHEKNARLLAAAKEMRDALDRLACIADTAAHYLRETDPEEAERFRADGRLAREVLAKTEAKTDGRT